MPNKGGRCNLHGGKSLAWFAHPNYKHGRYSKYSFEGARLRAERAQRKWMRLVWREFYKWLAAHPEPSIKQYTAVYYRKERDGVRVKSVYVGRGETAGLIAQFEEMQSEEREEKRALARMERERVQEQDAELDALGEMIRELAAATLIAHGYHQHKREWRRRRT